MKDRDWKLFLEDMLNSIDLENIWKMDNLKQTELRHLLEEWVELKRIPEGLMEVERRIAGYFVEVKYGQ